MPKQPKPTLKFRLDGNVIGDKSLSLTVRRVMEYADKMPDSDLISVKQLAAKLGYSHDNLQNYAVRAELGAYSVKLRYPQIQRVIGNKKTIAELSKRKELLA